MADILYENLTRDQADTYGLVLTSSGLPFSIRRSGRGWGIWVEASIRVRAQILIEQYIEENKHIPQTDEQETQTIEKTFTAVWVALLLLLLCGAIWRFGWKKM